MIKQKHIILGLLILNLLFVGSGSISLAENVKAQDEEVDCENILSLQNDILGGITDEEFSSETFGEYYNQLNTAIKQCSDKSFEAYMINNYEDQTSIEEITKDLNILDALDVQFDIERNYRKNTKDTKDSLSENLSSNLINQTLFNQFFENLEKLKKTTEKMNKEIKKAQRANQSNNNKIPKMQQQCM